MAEPAVVQEVGVSPVKGAEGAAFLSEVFAAQQAAPQAAVPSAPQVTPPAQSVVVQPPPPTQPQLAPGQVVTPPPAFAAQTPQPPPPPPPPPPPSSPVDFGSRYAGQQTVPADPLASLQEAPALAPESPIATPQNMNDQQNHAWATMRAQSNANRKLAEEYRAKYNQVVEATRKYGEEKTAFGEQLNAKEQRIHELEDEIGRMDLTRSPAFIEKYDAPINDVVGDIARTLVDNGYQQSAADDLARRVLAADHGDVPGLISELPTHVQGMIMVKAEQADGLFAARDQALADWRTSAEGLAAVQQRGNSLVAAQHMDKMASAAVNILHSMGPSTMPPAYQVVDPQFASDRDTQERKFRSWVQQAPEEQKYAAMLEGFMAPKTYEMLATTMAENTRLKQILASRGMLAAPPVGASPAYVPPPPPPPPQPPQAAQTTGFSPAPASEGMATEFLRQMFPQQAQMMQ